MLRLLQHTDYNETEKATDKRNIRDSIYKALPSLFGQAIVLVFQKYVRHGEYVLRVFDNDLVEMH